MRASLGDRIASWVDRRVRAPIARQRDRKRDFRYEGPQAGLVVYHHLGLGDHFICMGLVLELAERYARDGLFLAVKRGYVDTVRTLYAGHPQVRVLPVDAGAADRQVYGHARELDLKVARIGFEGIDRVHWDRSFYAQAGVEFGLSWSRFSPGDCAQEADALYQRLAPAPGYQLVHDDGSVGRFALDLPPSAARLTVRPEPSAAGLLAWCRIIREAAEIHCIDSSVVHLVDRLPDVPGQRLFLHDARRSGCTFTRRRAWQLVSYDG